MAATTAFDFVNISRSFTRATLIPIRARDHLVTVGVRVVVGTNEIRPISYHLDETFGMLAPVQIPLFFDTLRINVVKVSGAAELFQMDLLLDDQGPPRIFPVQWIDRQISAAAGATVTFATSISQMLHSQIAIVVNGSTNFSLIASWPGIIALGGDVLLSMGAGGGIARGIFPLVASTLTLTARNDDAIAVNNINLRVQLLP